MQKILKWFAPLVMSVVAIFLVFFLVSINSDDHYVETKSLALEQNRVDVKPQKTWLNHFSQSERLGYYYPVNEIFVTTNLSEKISKITTYKLSAKILDPYQLFCLKEELKRYDLKYSMVKDSTVVNLLIYSQDVNKLNSLVEILKEYKIMATIVPYKEEY